MPHPAAASPLSRCRAAYADYQRACDELRLLDALPYRKGYMQRRQAEMADWERRRAYAVARMRAACADAWHGASDAERRKMVRGNKTARARQKEAA